MLPRRILLTTGLGLAVAPVVAGGRRGGGDGGSRGVDGGGGGGGGHAACRVPDALAPMSEVAGAPLSYAESGTRQSFDTDPAFAALLQQWAGEWVAAAGLGALVEVSTYGAYVDKCPSWHSAGRAFDIAELIHENGTVSCRYDQWGDDPARLRAYWRLAASLSTRFTYTLGYPYNLAHHNHLHIDNGVNGYEAPSYNAGSAAQTTVVQGVLRHVFGADVSLTGSYDDITREAVRAVQRDHSIVDRLATPAGWRAFLDAAVASS